MPPNKKKLRALKKKAAAAAVAANRPEGGAGGAGANEEVEDELENQEDGGLGGLEPAPAAPAPSPPQASAPAPQIRRPSAVKSRLAASHNKKDVAIDYTNRGTNTKNEGRLEEGMKLYRKALEADPTYPVAWYNLGVCYAEQGLMDQARDCYLNAVKYEPKFALPHNNLGAYYKDAGDLERSVEHYKLAIRANPKFTQALSNISVVYHMQGALGDAQRSAEQAVKVDPKNPEAFNNLGTMYLDEGRSKEAVKCFEKCLQLAPEAAEQYGAPHNLLLSMNFREVDHEEDDAEDAATKAPDTTATDRLWLAHSEWGLASYNQSAILRFRNYDNDNTVNRTLRVGFISSDFRTHPVSYFIESPLRYLDRKKIDTFCYLSGAPGDQRTAQLQRWVPADRWKGLLGMDAWGVAELIRKDKIDILVELGGHASGNRLDVMVLKPCPVQVTWIGYPNTTGLPTIDYRITDDIADPPNTQQTYSETLIRMPSPCGFLCYSPTADAPNVGPLPALQNGYVTFGSFNTLAKITDLVFDTWCEVLNRVPKSRILLKTRALACSTIKGKYLRKFKARGIDSERVEMVTHVPSRTDHLNLYNRIDMSLDTFPYAGTTTTCEALYMGVPAITWRRTRRPIHAQNVGAALQMRIPTLDVFVAHSRQEYIDIAVKFSQELQQLSEIRSKMRKNMLESPVCNGPLFASKLEEVFIDMWDRHCEDTSLATTDDRYAAQEELNLATRARLSKANKLTGDVDFDCLKLH